MTDDEWDTFAMLLDKGFKWREPFGEAHDFAYRALLDGYESTDLADALRVLTTKGQVFGPTPGEIIAQIHHDASAPTFSEMVRLIFGPRGVLSARTQDRRSSWGPGERDRADQDAMLERAAGMHPLVASFIAREGIGRLRSLNLNDEDWGEANRRQLQARWEQHVEVSGDRDVAALVAPRRGEMAKLDPLAALGLQVPVAALERGGEV